MVRHVSWHPRHLYLKLLIPPTWQEPLANSGNVIFPGGSASSDDGDDLVERESEPNEESQPVGRGEETTR